MDVQVRSFPPRSVESFQQDLVSDKSSSGNKDRLPTNIKVAGVVFIVFALITAISIGMASAVHHIGLIGCIAITTISGGIVIHLANRSVRKEIGRLNEEKDQLNKVAAQRLTDKQKEIDQLDEKVAQIEEDAVSRLTDMQGEIRAF